MVVAEALGKVYDGGVRAVDRIDFEVRSGELFGLLGPNGAGKTTTVGMLTTRVVPTAGRALVAGVDVAAQPTLAKQLLGVVPQQTTLDRSLTVFENLYYHGRYFGLGARRSRQLAGEMLELFALGDRANAEVRTLSGGMTKRLMLARALLHQPPVLFLDEPTAGLDPQSRLALWELLRGSQEEGQTIVLTTHDMHEADKLCDRVAIIDHGRLLALDQPDALTRTLGLAATVKLTPNGNPAALAERLRGLAGTGTARLADSSVLLEVREPERALPRLLIEVEEAGFPIRELSLTAPTLETVFLHLTGRELRE